MGNDIGQGIANGISGIFGFGDTFNPLVQKQAELNAAKDSFQNMIADGTLQALQSGQQISEDLFRLIGSTHEVLEDIIKSLLEFP